MSGALRSRSRLGADRGAVVDPFFLDVVGLVHVGEGEPHGARHVTVVIDAGSELGRAGGAGAFTLRPFVVGLAAAVRTVGDVSEGVAERDSRGLEPLHLDGQIGGVAAGVLADEDVAVGTGVVAETVFAVDACGGLVA